LTAVAAIEAAGAALLAAAAAGLGLGLLVGRWVVIERHRESFVSQM